MYLFFYFYIVRIIKRKLKNMCVDIFIMIIKVVIYIFEEGIFFLKIKI